MTTKKESIKEESVSLGLRAWARRLLFGPLRLRRHDGTLRLTWGESLLYPKKKPRRRTSRAAADVKASTGGVTGSMALMRSELRIVLNAKPHNRDVLRHLVFFEAALARKGLLALDDIPVKPLRKAHDQLQLLAEAVASRDLTDLARMMAQAIIRRTGDVDVLLGEGVSRPAPLEVAEGRLSDFFRLADEVPDTAPANTGAGRLTSPRC